MRFPCWYMPIQPIRPEYKPQEEAWLAGLWFDLFGQSSPCAEQRRRILEGID